MEWYKSDEIYFDRITMELLQWHNKKEDTVIHGEQTIIEYIDAMTLAKKISLTDDAKLHYILIVRDAEVSIDIICSGVRSNAEVCCIFLSKDTIKVKAKMQGILGADHSTADLYLLSLLGEKADAVVDGGVIISPDVIKVSGHLLEDNVLLGKKVKIKTLPMLDVRSSDVSASHGARIDRLDENKLFYMMAKGLDQLQAQRLIVQGYIERIFTNAQSTDHTSP